MHIRPAKMTGCVRTSFQVYFSRRNSPVKEIALSACPSKMTWPPIAHPRRPAANLARIGSVRPVRLEERREGHKLQEGSMRHERLQACVVVHP